MSQTMGFGVIVNSQDGDGYELRPVLKDVIKQKLKENEQMTEGELKRWESVVQTTGTMEAIRENPRRSELDKERRLIKDNLKGAIYQKTKTGLPESSDEERKKERYQEMVIRGVRISENMPRQEKTEYYASQGGFVFEKST